MGQSKVSVERSACAHLHRGCTASMLPLHISMKSLHAHLQSPISRGRKVLKRVLLQLVRSAGQRGRDCVLRAIRGASVHHGHIVHHAVTRTTVRVSIWPLEARCVG